MSMDFKLKQHLKMSLNAQVKNLVPENLIDIPARDDWRLGRIWFNTSIGKLQGVFLKLDIKTGLPVEPEEWEIRVVGADALGPTKDGEYWPDGLLQFDEQTKIADAMDEVNEALKDLAPAEATLLMGDLELDVSYNTGKLSILTNSPDTINISTLIPGETISTIINSSDINMKLPTDGLIFKGQKQSQFGRADKGKLVAYLDTVPIDSGIDLFSAFNEPTRDYYGALQGFIPPINQTIIDSYGIEKEIVANPNKELYKSSTGSLIVTTVERYNDFKKWQKGSGEIKLSLDAGLHSIYVSHEGLIDIHKTNTTTLFYDPNKIMPSIEIIDVVLKTGNIKYISGIPFYTDNITFDVKFKVNDLFNYTYWDKPISISINNGTEKLLNWNEIGSTLEHSQIPLWSDVFSIDGYNNSYNKVNSVIDKIKVGIKAGKPATGWSSEKVFIKDILIDTYAPTGNSTALKETFFDETFRLDPTSVNFNNVLSVNSGQHLWDSTLPLTDGNAQIVMGALTKASTSFSKYGIPMDYTQFSNDDQAFYRSFTSFDKPNSNGILSVTTNSILGTDFDIFIKFPELTAWLDIKILFDSVVFASHFNIDGTGCGTNLIKTSKGYEIPWTMGTFSTYDSGFTYVIKVVVKTSTCKITEIAEIAETWR